MSLERQKNLLKLQSFYYTIQMKRKQDTKDILQQITQKYVDTYGVEDLAENDKECLRSLIGIQIQIGSNGIL